MFVSTTTTTTTSINIIFYNNHQQQTNNNNNNNNNNNRLQRSSSSFNYNRLQQSSPSSSSSSSTIIIISNLRNQNNTLLKITLELVCKNENTLSELPFIQQHQQSMRVGRTYVWSRPANGSNDSACARMLLTAFFLVFLVSIPLYAGWAERERKLMIHGYEEAEAMVHELHGDSASEYNSGSYTHYVSSLSTQSVCASSDIQASSFTSKQNVSSCHQIIE